jgi:hypothetical protein
MKRIPFVMLIAWALLAAGCEDVADRLSQPILQSPPQVRVFSGDTRAVYAAAKAALDSMDYRLTHGGPAEGTMEAVSEIVPGDAPDSTKQISLKAEFRAAENGGTEVTVRVTEITEHGTGAGAGPAGESPGAVAASSMGTGPIYEVFFRATQQSLNSAQK